MKRFLYDGDLWPERRRNRVVLVEQVFPKQRRSFLHMRDLEIDCWMQHWNGPFPRSATYWRVRVNMEGEEGVRLILLSSH